MDTYFDLGGYSFPVTTQSTEAQTWFDRGILWTYGYNHEEAVTCFERAIDADPKCAMAHWGAGYAAGPNYNMPWELFDYAGRAAAARAGYAHARKALDLIDGVTGWEAALIHALPARHPQPDPLDPEVMKAWNADFADAMRDVFAAHPESHEVRTVFAESLLNLTPWKMWDLTSGQPAAGARTVEAQTVLEEALEGDPSAMHHPGLLHLYVHLMEMSPFPEKALKAGDALRRLVPDAGHLIHMPTHIDILCGHYQNVVDWNEAAIEADLKFYEERGAFNIYTWLSPAQLPFRDLWRDVSGPVRAGHACCAGDGGDHSGGDVAHGKSTHGGLLRKLPEFWSTCSCRFGRWREATQLELPDDPDLYCTKAAHVHYARAIGHAALGEVDAALAEEALYNAAIERVPESRTLHNNTVVDLLAIGSEMLRGEILYRQEKYDEAYAALRRAIVLEDTLPYDEPWGWMQPVRHALGALLLEQGHTDEAEAGVPRGSRPLQSTCTCNRAPG
jgi:tetratricopeptide (TPR) repeat protein